MTTTAESGGRGGGGPTMTEAMVAMAKVEW